MNPKHILLPTDLSELSLRPIERAPELFEGRKVTLLHTVESIPVMATSAPFAPPLEDPAIGPKLVAAKESLEKMAKALPGSQEVHIEAISCRHSGKDIAAYASKHDVDLIVVSTHGRTGLRRFALGSVAESILRHATMPVLAFPAKEGTFKDES
ncbi:MAG: nucleotide-binding universal stress UspA family protein [Planctomycetota bacterium]|jgi:nucleotide-binding universal stress UspA family protein